MEMYCHLLRCEELHMRSHSHSLRDHLCCSKRSWMVILFLKSSDVLPYDVLSLCMYMLIGFGKKFSTKNGFI